LVEPFEERFEMFILGRADDEEIRDWDLRVSKGPSLVGLVDCEG
jgi:hypothetical protein